MFKDLKEYQEITQLYHDSVNISEEQREINKLFLEADFTAEEIEYLDENFDELWESELSSLTEDYIVESYKQQNLTEEQLNEILGTALVGGLAKSAKPLLKKGVKVAGKAIKSVKTGVKDIASGAKTVAKKALGKVKDVVKKAAPVLKRIPGIALPAAAVGGVIAGVNKLRNIGKDKREAETKKNETKVTPPPQIGGGNAGGSTDSGGTAGGDKGGEKQPDPPKQTETKKKKMHPIEKKNRARLGDEKVDKLKQKQADFKKMRKGEMSKADFIKNYPQSITAQRAAGLRDHTEWDAYDMVLEYLYSTEQVDSIEEANYVMMEMDQETIGSIVSEVRYVLDEGFVDNLKAGFKKVKNVVGGVKDKVEKRIERRKENVSINKRIKEKQANPDNKTKAQVLALQRKKEKLNNPEAYAKKQAMTGTEKAQAMAKARLANKNK